MNIFVICSKSLTEKCRALNSGPWTFLVLTSPSATDQPMDMDFNFCAFWIQIHNIPFQCMTTEMASFLGTKIGEVEKVECEGSDGWACPFIRIKVKIDITKPLRRGTRIENSDRKGIGVPFDMKTYQSSSIDVVRLGILLENARNAP